MSTEADSLNVRLNLDSPDARAAVIDLVDKFGSNESDCGRDVRTQWLEQLVCLVRARCAAEHRRKAVR